MATINKTKSLISIEIVIDKGFIEVKVRIDSSQCNLTEEMKVSIVNLIKDALHLNQDKAAPVVNSNSKTMVLCKVTELMVVRDMFILNYPQVKILLKRQLNRLTTSITVKILKEEDLVNPKNKFNERKRIKNKFEFNFQKLIKQQLFILFIL